MARIDTYTARQGLNPGSTPDARIINPVADQLVNLGEQTQAIASTLIDRNEQKENFKVENDYRKLQIELGRDLEAQSQEIPEGGDGFHDAFLSDTYRPKRDAFLANVPERLREKFSVLLDDDAGADTAEWSVRAATVERDENYRWQTEQIKLTQEEMAVAISMQPDAYDDFFQSGKALIASSSLPASEKAKLELEWENMAQVSMLNHLLETDPSGVLRELGYDPRRLSPTTQFDMLSKAVQSAESADNPNAVSPKGAVGLMQVMPGTAEDIAKALGDENFPTGTGKEYRDAVAEYLTNPAVNKRYGEYYLREQLRRFANTRDPVETALIAYNWGPENAAKWVESGYDDKLLPKETRDYRDKILKTLKPAAVKGDPSSVSFVGLGEGVNPDLQSRVADAFATVGQTKVKVNSGYRSAAKNKEVGGADESQHLDGNAMDIDVSGMSRADRIELIKALSAAGITGIGVYSNTIHADLGGRRAWGPDHHDTSIPAWAAPVITQHLNGTTPPPRAVNSRYASLPYDQRQQFTSKADQLITNLASEAAKVSAADKVIVRQQMDNELARVRATGQGDPDFDVTNISTILGEDDYLKFSRDFDVAQRTFTATSGIATMLPEQMEQRFLDYTPDPGSADFADQERIQAAVQKEIDRVTRMRSSAPDQAALEFPEVKGAYDALQQQAATGQLQPATAQNLVIQMLNAQTAVGIAREAQAPVPRGMALEVGRGFSQLPEYSGKANVAAIQAAVAEQYALWQTVFGEYTDEVIIYSLSEYKGISKELATALTGLVTQVRDGTGVYRPKQVDQVIDQENERNWLGTMFDVGPGARDLLGLPNGQPAVLDQEPEPSAEEMIRRAQPVEE
jgi:hypothetical protein